MSSSTGVRDDLAEVITRNVIAVKNGRSDNIETPAGPPENAAENEFLFFMKPELTGSPGTASWDRLMSLILGALSRHKMEVGCFMVSSGDYLDRHGIVSSHYGVIDAIARDPASALSDAARDRFLEIYDVPAERATLVGGLQYLASHPDLEAEQLSREWLSRGYEKLSGGTYCQYLSGEGLYLFNAFYPRMLAHFTSPGQVLVSMVLRSDTRWKTARRVMIGATEPSKAVDGSLRHELLEHRKDFGIDEISTNLNGVHLSAGPVEGLVELRRFTTNFDERSEEKPVAVFRFGAALLDVFDPHEVEVILSNPEVVVDDAEQTVYDVTEELDSTEALELLGAVCDQFR